MNMSNIRNNKIRKYAYATYDFSNSGYVIIFQSFLFPLFFANSISENKWSFMPGEIWGWLVSFSVLLSCILAPILGRLGDVKGKSRVFTSLVVMVGFLAAFTPFVFANNIALLICSYILFNAFFELSQSIYNSFLNVFTDSQSEANSLSTFSWGFGYVGGALFAILYFFLNKVGMSNATFLSVAALLYLAISLFPIIIFKQVETDNIDKVKLTASGEITKPKSKVKIDLKILFIYWVIGDCVAGIMSHAVLFAKTELLVSTPKIGALLLGVQLLAFPLTTLAGNLANRLSSWKVIQISLLFWLVSVGGLYFAKSFSHLVLVMLIISFVIGSTQSLMRSHYAGGFDSTNSGEAFGYFTIANSTSSMITPAVISIIVSITGEIRQGFLFLFILLSAAIALSFGMARGRKLIPSKDAISVGDSVES